MFREERCTFHETHRIFPSFRGCGRVSDRATTGTVRRPTRAERIFEKLRTTHHPQMKLLVWGNLRKDQLIHRMLKPNPSAVY